MIKQNFPMNDIMMCILKFGRCNVSKFPIMACSFRICQIDTKSECEPSTEISIKSAEKIVFQYTQHFIFYVCSTITIFIVTLLLLLQQNIHHLYTF